MRERSISIIETNWSEHSDEITRIRARLQRGGKIERVSILKPSRKKGLGSKLMRFIINSAKKREFERVYLHSQMGSIDFYKGLGFRVKGAMFQEAGINHVLMVLEDE